MAGAWGPAFQSAWGNGFNYVDIDDYTPPDPPPVVAPSSGGGAPFAHFSFEHIQRRERERRLAKLREEDQTMLDTIIAAVTQGRLH